MDEQKRWAVLLAAGSGMRFSPLSVDRKQHVQIHGHCLFCYALSILTRVPGMAGVVLVVAADDDRSAAIVDQYHWDVPVYLCVGGLSRSESVRRGVAHLSSLADSKDWVMIHDAARPALRDEDCFALFATLSDRHGARGAFLAYPEIDVLYETEEGDMSSPSLLSGRYYRALTPQVFRYGELCSVVLPVSTEARDEVSAFLSYGQSDGLYPVVTGPHNIKITYQHDLKAMAHLLQGHPLLKHEDCSLRVGQGYDIHRWGSDHSLVLGGVCIPYEKGLIGHSDADVLLHALMDAFLGAAGQRDIGCYFPDTDPQYHRADSQALLRFLCENSLKNYRIINVDATIIAQEPRLSPFVDAMKVNVASILSIDVQCVGIKCKTAEHMGAVGRNEGIAAQAVVLISKIL